MVKKKQSIDGVALILIVAGFFFISENNLAGWILVIMGVLKQFG